jgi:hypothetical protein
MATASSTSRSTASARKIAANRRNARRSTGPRTQSGKRRSSRNATTHGVFCQDLVLEGESREIFDAFRETFLLRLSPQDVLELLIVDRIVAASWKLRRLQEAELVMHAAESDDLNERAREEREQIEDQLRISSTDSGRERFPAAVTLATSLCRDEGSFERLTRMEQRLEQMIYRSLEQLRRLRNAE